MNIKTTLQALVPVALGLVLAACSSQQTLQPKAAQPKEAQSPAPVEAYAAPAPGPIVATDAPITPAMKTSLATPPVSPKRSADPSVETSGPLSEPQRAVMSAVATCMQKSVDKGAKLGAKSVIVNVTVDTSGAVSAVDIDGATAATKTCAEAEIRKVRYPKTDESGGMRVMQYPISATLQDPDAADE